MTECTFTITDARGFHARPAAQLVTLLKGFDCNVALTNGGKTIDPRKTFALMNLRLQRGDHVTFTLHGADEAEAAQAIAQFMHENLSS